MSEEVPPPVALVAAEELTSPMTTEEFVPPVMAEELVSLVTAEELSSPVTAGEMVSPLKLQQPLELLELCLSCTYFSFKGSFYRMKHGTAMGSPVSPIVANLYMEKFERTALSVANPPAFWYRYVDDTLTTRKDCDIEPFTAHLNSIDPQIQFTSEVEKDNQISFLDTLILRQADGSIHTKVFRKPTHTDQYLGFNSHHPLQHKRSVVRTLLRRAEVLVTKDDDKKAEKEHVKRALHSNQYPDWILDAPKPQQTRSSRRGDIRVGIPYIKGTSERLARAFKDHGVEIYHQPTNSLRSRLSHVKDISDKGSKCGTVYHIQCSECDEDYIGETERTLQTRFKEHQTRPSSAFHEHLTASSHSINLCNTTVLDTEPNFTRRKVKESIEIRTRRPSLNRDLGYELPPVYNSLFNRGRTVSRQRTTSELQLTQDTNDNSSLPTASARNC